MRIVHVIGGLAASSGTTETVIGLCRGLAEVGVESAVATVGPVESPTLDALLGIQNVSTHIFPASVPKSWTFSKELTGGLSNVVMTGDFVVLHGVWTYPTLLGAIVAKHLKKPYALRPAGGLEPGALAYSSLRKRFYFQLFERSVMANSSFIYCTAQAEAEHLLELGCQLKRTRIIPNAYNSVGQETTQKASARHRLDIRPDERVVVHMGRIHPKKNIENTLAAARCLIDEGMDLTFLVAGPIDSDFARRLAAQYAGPRIHFLGEVHGELKAQVLAAADLFVLVSESENFGVAVLEALAAGTAALVSSEMPWQPERTGGATISSGLNTEDIRVNLASFFALNREKRTLMIEAARATSITYSWQASAQQLMLAIDACALGSEAKHQGSALGLPGSFSRHS